MSAEADCDVIRGILEELSAEPVLEGAEVLCSCETDYSPEVFSSDLFSEVVAKTVPEKKFFFIDGGNCEIFSSPDICVHFIRIFHTVYSGDRRVSCSKDEFYVLCRTGVKDGNVFFSAKLFRSKVNSLTDAFFTESFWFDPLDSCFVERNSRMVLDRVPGMIRRIGELSTALILAGDADAGDVVVVDGDLCAKTGDDRKILRVLREVSLSKKVSICALSKTSDMLNSRGGSVVTTLSAAAPYASWVYSPAAVRAGATIAFVKLHPKSDYVFKFEFLEEVFSQGGLQSGLNGVVQEIVSILASNSTDVVFLGYPYGLIEADRFARVSNREREVLRTMFMARAGNLWGCMAARERSLDAHSVLDRIS